MPEIIKEIEIVNKLGMHARPAARLVQVTSRFSSDINFKRGSDEVNGKSIMGVLMLAAPYGSKITVIARGDDADEAIKEIESLILAKFGEE
ncbi:MAG: HPr family phosphocarrier protein [Candidatus Auribacterota bacterium]|nr:HPr family phosphocarrier protein [Candidatus Auribacterota bacterium]